LIISSFPLAVFSQLLADSFDLALFTDSSCSQRLGNLSSVTSQPASLSGQCSSSPSVWVTDGFPSYNALCSNITTGTGGGNWNYLLTLTTYTGSDCPGISGGPPQGNFTYVRYGALSDPQSSRGECVQATGINVYPSPMPRQYAYLYAKFQCPAAKKNSAMSISSTLAVIIGLVIASILMINN